MDEPPFAFIAYLLLGGLGFVSLSFLFLQTKDWWQGRTGHAVATVPAKASQVSPIARSRPPDTATERPSSAPNSPEDRGRLQLLLNEGVKLEQNAPALIDGLENHWRCIRETRLEDVDPWEAEVEAALRDRPVILGSSIMNGRDHRCPHSPSRLENPLSGGCSSVLSARDDHRRSPRTICSPSIPRGRRSYPLFLGLLAFELRRFAWRESGRGGRAGANVTTITTAIIVILLFLWGSGLRFRTCRGVGGSSPHAAVLTALFAGGLLIVLGMWNRR